MSDQTNDNDDNNENKPMKIVFAQGCFDDFEGTQEELDELVAHITALAESGELFEKATPVEGDLIEKLDGLVDAVTEYDVDEHGYVKFPFEGNTRH